MRIAYVARSPVPSTQANSIHAMKMAAAYASLGHRVSLFAPAAPSGHERPPGSPWEFYGVRRVFRLRSVPALVASVDTINHGVVFPLVVAAARPQLVHARFLLPALRLATVFSIPTIFEPHHLPSADARWCRSFARLAQSCNLVAVVAITQALAGHLRSMLPGRVKLVVAPDGADSAGEERTLSRAQARRRLGLPDTGPPMAVYAGHLYPGRGIETIIETARRLPAWTFSIVGGTPERLRHYAGEARGLDNVVLVGHRPPAEVPLWLAAADALLMPYGDRVEVAGGGDTSAVASPLKMFEYLAAGRPILASRLPVLREVLSDGVNAILLPHERPEQWAAALEHIAADPGGAEVLAAQAVADARRYSWENRAGCILAGAAVGSVSASVSEDAGRNSAQRAI